MNLGLGLGLTASRPSKVVKNYTLTSALPSGATFTRASSGTRVNASGVVVTETTNAPRFDYNPATLAALGIYIEPASTNLLLYSENFTGTGWTGFAASVSSVTATNPAGGSTSHKLVESATTAEHGIFRSVTTTGTHTLSVYAKESGRRYCYLRRDGTSNAVFDLTAGTVTEVNGSVTASITAAGNGWYRLSLTSSETGSWVLKLSDAGTGVNNNRSYAGNGTSGVLLWGAQIEAGSSISSYVPTTTAAVTRAVDVLTLPVPDGIWDITTTDSTGSTTTRTSVVSGYPVSPRSGQTRVKSVRAALVASYAGFDSDAKTWLKNNQLVHVAGSRAIDATVKAIKADGTLTYADIVFAGLAPGRNKDAGTTVKTLGGWSAALIDGTLSSESRMRTGDPYGLYTNNGDTTTNTTRITFPSVPLGTTYAIVAVVAPKGNPSAERAILSTGGNGAAYKQLGSTGLVLASDVDSSFTRGLRAGRANAVGFIQEVSSVGRALGELGYNRTTTLNVTGTNTIYFGSQFIAGSTSNTQIGGNPEIILEAVAWMKNPSAAKVTALGNILRSNLCVQPTAPIEGFFFTGQSQASRDAATMLDQILANDSTYGRNFLQQNYTHSNQPISEWVGAGPTYARSNFYNTDLLPSGGLWQTLLAQETRTARTSGLFWFQGEADFGYSQGISDAAAEARAAAYEAKLQALINFWREDYPGIPIVLFQVDWVSTGSYTLSASNILCRDTVRAAQAAVAAANDGIALVDTRGMARDSVDGIHLTNTGRLAAMQAGWIAMKALL